MNGSILKIMRYFIFFNVSDLLTQYLLFFDISIAPSQGGWS